LEGAWIYASGIIEGSSGDSLWYWNETSTDEMGSYKLYLPLGEYEIKVDYWDYDDNEEFYCSAYFDVSIGSGFTEENVVLSQVTMDGTISGNITDENNNPIWSHYVYVEGDGGCGDYGWYAGYWTDQDGSYHIDLPNGNYTISTWDNCSDTGDVNEDFVINNNDVTVDFTVCPYYDEECYQYDQWDCEYYEHCRWDDYYGQCVHDYDEGDEGPPECLLGCEGIENIDGDDPMQVCAFLGSVWGIDGSCADDCEDDEDYQELNMMAYMCEGCFDANALSDTTCVVWFDFLDDHDPCGQCHDECYDVGDDDEGTCHDACEANECACDDDDPCCQCHDTCGGDDTCHQNCDEGDCAADDGPPECLSECEGIDAIDPEEDASGFCTWLTGTDISSCSYTPY